MAGAHFDSWVAGDAAIDVGAGSAVVMEAARIIRKLGIRPKRTIRFVLWSAEEQGLLGSLSLCRQISRGAPWPDRGRGRQRALLWLAVTRSRQSPVYGDLVPISTWTMAAVARDRRRGQCRRGSDPAILACVTCEHARA